MVTDYIKNKINSATPETLFFNRDFINFGARSAVDMCLSRMTRVGFLKRLCYGVYVRHDCEKEFSAIELGEAKAKRFNRGVSPHPVYASNRLKFTTQGTLGQTFHAHGRSTSFFSQHGRIYFRATSSRRVSLKELQTGEVINALWWLKRDKVTEGHILQVLQGMKRTEKEEFLWSHDAMPGWLSDMVHRARGWKITFPLKKTN